MAKSKVKQRPDGRYAMQIYIGRKDGKRHYKTVYGKTPKEVENKALEIRLAMRKGMDISAANDSFGDWLDRLLRVRKAKVSAARYKVYECAAKKLVSLRPHSISKITSADIDVLLAEYIKFYSVSHVKEIRSLANQTFNLALENRVIDYNPVTPVKVPQKAEEPSVRALSEDEQSWIFETTDHRAQPAALTMMLSGLRRGELIALTWNSVDFENKTIKVTNSVEVVEGKFKLKLGAKTKAGERVIPIPIALHDRLLKERQKSSSLYVTSQKNGFMHTPSSWRRMWESYLVEINVRYGDFEAAGLDYIPMRYTPKKAPFVVPEIRPHWLRHTYASLLYMSGVDVMTAKELMGHADIKTTLNIYTHLSESHKTANVDKLDEHIAKMQVKCKSSSVDKTISAM